MNDATTRPGVPPVPEEPADPSYRPADADAPHGLIATWRERIRFRWKLAQMAQDNPHLLRDIGLTRQQVETEIAKRFWQR